MGKKVFSVAFDNEILADIDEYCNKQEFPVSRTSFLLKAVKFYLESKKPTEKVNYIKILDQKLNQRFNK